MLVCAKPHQADTCLEPTQRPPLPIAVGSGCHGEFDERQAAPGSSGGTSKITGSAENKSSADSPTSTRSPPQAQEYSQVTTTIMYSSPTGADCRRDPRLFNERLPHAGPACHRESVCEAECQLSGGPLGLMSAGGRERADAVERIAQPVLLYLQVVA
jgi:hypothetical protein